MSMPVTGTNSQNNVTSTNDTSSVSQETTKNLLSGQGIAGSSYVNASDNTSTALSVFSAAQEKTIDKLLTERLGVRDSDLRDLLKLLIAAFAQLNNTQRMTDLTALQGLVEACKAKIEQMKTAAKEQYNAAMDQAIGQIVGGALSIGISVASVVGTLHDAKGLENGTVKLTNKGHTVTTKESKEYIKVWQAVGGMAQPTSGIVTGICSWVSAKDTADKSAAEIQQEQLNLTMEIMRKALDQCSSSKKELMDAIQQMIQFIQQLIQQACATEKTIVQA